MSNTVINLNLEGVMCEGCVNTIKNALSQNEQITDVSIVLADKTAQITSSLSAQQIIALIEKSGYGASEK